ncbi:MAG TPA: hypothetical protein VI589_06955 [Vicinamibacteria bacterium]
MTDPASLTTRIETCIDRWNLLPREPRHEVSGQVTRVSLGLGELVKLRKALESEVEALEKRLDKLEASAPA